MFTKMDPLERRMNVDKKRVSKENQMVKNKSPAEVQITAEQLLREAKERDLEILPPPPQQKISDEVELADYKLRKRKLFEDNIRRNHSSIVNYLKYAEWEESQKELDRARSVYERALDIDYRNITIWLKYAEMEMRNRLVNHARNLWDRAVSLLPRVNQFWYKYTYMEEMLDNVAGARHVFERWMKWEPDEQAWNTFINFEMRYNEIDRARQIYERFITIHPDPKNWIKYARFEERLNSISKCREVYERAIEFFGDENLQENLLLSFARFEESQKDFDRAEVIYKYAIDNIKDETRLIELHKAYAVYVKKHGNQIGIDFVVVRKQKMQYECQLKEDPTNYDMWFNYIRCVEEEGRLESIRDAYEQAIANVPSVEIKDCWRRYIYLWINYALMEEIDVKDVDRTREVYKMCLKVIPHKKFTFAKIWLMYAQFEIRNNNLKEARHILGTAIGMCPKDKLFRSYIELEFELREFDRCRILYEKFLEFCPENCLTWIRYAELENLLRESERSRGIYELALQQTELDMPEILWKSYIDFEISKEEFSKVRKLYERLLEKTSHVKVWLSYINFENNNNNNNKSEMVKIVRRIFERANETFKWNDDKDSRAIIFDFWKKFEDEYGDEDSQKKISDRLPKKIKKRQRIENDQEEEEWQEIDDYSFPDDELSRPCKVLKLAKDWKHGEQLKKF